MNLLVTHMLGDYVFQNRWMALNKQNNKYIALLHAIIYTSCIALFTPFIWWKLSIILLSHYLIDHYRLAKYWRKFFSHDVELPWIILSDNTIHLLILWLLYGLC